MIISTDTDIMQGSVGAFMPIVGLMCCSVGVFVKPTEERKCIVDHKKELSNVGAPGFPFPHQGQRVYAVRGQKVTVDP